MGHDLAVHHPWRALREEQPDWQVLFVELPDNVDGMTDLDHRTIWIDKRLGQAARRSTLTHEAIHAVRLHAETTEWDEAQVEQEAARILLPIDRLVDVLRWAHNLGEAADELWVDEQLLRVRLNHLHPAERAAINRAFASRDNNEEPPP